MSDRLWHLERDDKPLADRFDLGAFEQCKVVLVILIGVGPDLLLLFVIQHRVQQAAKGLGPRLRLNLGLDHRRNINIVLLDLKVQVLAAQKTQVLQQPALVRFLDGELRKIDDLLRAGSLSVGKILWIEFAVLGQFASCGKRKRSVELNVF